MTRLSLPPSLSWNALAVARALAIGCMLALLVSPPLTNLFEALLVVVVAASGEIRQRLRAVVRQPLVIAALVLAAMVILAACYAEAPARTAFGAVNGWRKLLLLPIAAALFDDDSTKRRLALWFVGVVAAFAVCSWYSAAVGHLLWPVREGEPPGVVIHNHLTQGVMFAVAGFCAVVLLSDRASQDRRMRLALAACALLLLGNVVFITTGRSGYVAFLACAVAFAIARLRATRVHRGKALLAALAALAVLAGLLFASPHAREGIRRAIDESRNYQQQQQTGELTSMGIRQYFWRNSLALIGQRPLFGHGTGSYETAYTKLIAGRTGIAATPSADPHQQYLRIAVEQGLVGLAIFLGFLFAATRQRPGEPWRVMGLGVLGAWCLTSLANSHFTTFAEGTFIFLWMGAMLANGRAGTPEARSAREGA